jgi:hypothetical protein
LYCGGGLLHTLDLCIDPTPHVEEQEERSVHADQPPSIGQIIPVSHAISSISTPKHFFPPYSGTGLLQILLREIIPLPHDTGHFVHNVHIPHPPSTGHGMPVSQGRFSNFLPLQGNPPN